MVAVPACVSATAAEFWSVSVVAVEAVQRNVPLFGDDGGEPTPPLTNPATTKVIPAKLLLPPLMVPVYTAVVRVATATLVNAKLDTAFAVIVRVYGVTDGPMTCVKN